MRRVMIYDRQDRPIGELSPSEVFELSRKEAVNGEHSLTITTTRVLEQGWRILTQDGTGKWREHVVYGTDALHDSGERPIGTYYCVWSLQHDLMGTRVSRMPGVQTPVAAGVALGFALEGTSRWQVGTVTNTSTGGASMYDMDGWSAMAVLVSNWGGEVDATIEVGSTGITARKADLYAKQGDQTPKRRYDLGADLRSVRRKVADGPLYCRITPRGMGETTDTGGYGRKVTIEDANGGRDYLENVDMVPLAKLPDGNGGWEYPTLEVENADCETPEELLAWAQSILEESTAPKVTYEIDVLQLAAEGTDMHGVGLGDAIQVVDKKFGEGVRVSGRVTAQTVNMLDENDVQLTIGYVDGGLAGMFASMGNQVSALTTAVQTMNGGTLSTADYLNRLLERLNAEINATGGYTYITEGQGIRTYDKAVADPLVGAEADAVVEIKGGTIRIANSRTAQGEWDWKTVFTSGRIAADMVTAANITAGYIGSAAADGSYSGTGNYWNLDTGELRMASTATIDGQSIADYIADNADVELTQQGVFNALTNNGAIQGLYMSNGQLYINANYLKTGILTDNAGRNFWNLNTGEFSLMQDIGVSNYLDGTEKWTAWSRKGGWTFSGDTATCAAKSSVANWNDRLISPWLKLPYKQIRGYKATFSFEGASSDAWGTQGELNQIAVVFGLYNSSKTRIAHAQRNFTLSTAIKRKSVTLDMVDGTFVYDSPAMTGTSLSGLYLQVCVYNRSKHRVQIRKVKLERGTQATDWSRSQNDMLQYAKDETKALSDSLNQAGIFNRLFPEINGSRPHGMRLVNGRAYLNASYINTGTLNAKYIKAGVLSDNLSNPNNSWNLATGKFVTKNAKMTDAVVTGQMTCGDYYKLRLANNGQLIGYRNGKRQCYIDATAASRNLTNNQMEYGMQLQANQIIRISSPHLAIKNSKDTSQTATFGWTGKKEWRVIERIEDAGNGGIRWWWTTHGIQCINGIVVSAW